MRIGFDAKRAFSNAAGLGNFSRNTISALLRQYPEDNYFLFHPGGTRQLFIAPENSSEIKPEGFLWKIWKNLWRTLLISRLADRNDLDIYHGLSHELPVGIEKTGVKTVVTIHDLIYLRYPDYYTKIDRNIYDRKFRHACRVADLIHAISEQTRQDLIRYFAVPEEKIKVVYQAINPIFFEQKEPEAKKQLQEKYQLPERFLLTVGTIEPRKNLLALLEGMVASQIKVPLVVVGKSTSYQPKVQSYLEANPEWLQIIFLSGVEDSELAVFYQLAEIMIYPSLFEGFGLPVAEAQASGCPVITSGTSSLPETGGDAAWYINPEKPGEIGMAIEALLANPDRRETMIAKGKINAQRFTPENFATQLKQLYNLVLND